MSDDEVALEHKAVDRAHARLIARLSQANGIQPQDVTRAIRDLIAASYQAGCAALAEARRGTIEECERIAFSYGGNENSASRRIAERIHALAAPDQGGADDK